MLIVTILLMTSLWTCTFSQNNNGGPHAPIRPDYRWADEKAVETWRDMKFGLRIHWGLYAENGMGPESWPLKYNKTNTTFLKWWWDQANTFDPKEFDAEKWITMMNNAGVKYFDFTTKHHEGFSMYDTNTRIYECWAFGEDGTFQGIKSCESKDDAEGIAFSITEHTGRDIVDELVRAARAGGVKPGLYFSHIDWFDPAMRIDENNPLGTGACVNRPCDPALYNRSTDPKKLGTIRSTSSRANHRSAFQVRGNFRAIVRYGLSSGIRRRYARDGSVGT